MFRQQLKFKVSRLRQFQGMPPQTTPSSEQDLEIQRLKREIEDRDRLIAEQVYTLFILIVVKFII